MKALLNLNYGSGGGRDRRGPPRHCDFADCTQSTREGKAYCSDHVEEHPYAKWVIAQIELREKEIARVTKRGPKAVSVASGVTRDLMGFIAERGTCSVERLRRERAHDVDEEVVRSYMLALEKKGLVCISHSARGSMTIRATEAMAAVVA